MKARRFIGSWSGYCVSGLGVTFLSCYALTRLSPEAIAEGQGWTVIMGFVFGLTLLYAIHLLNKD